MENERTEKRRSPAVLIMSVCVVCVAAAVFAAYVKYNFGIYSWYQFAAPFAALALFTAALVLAMPRIVSAISGDDDLPYPAAREKATVRRFVLICLAALALHICTSLLGMLLFRLVSEGAEALSFETLWKRSWMKSNTDARHYIFIAENWYTNEGDDALLIVFFPLFPLFIRVFNLITHNSFYSAQIINAAATALTAGFTYVTLIPVIGEKRARIGAFVYLLLPGAIFLNSPMSEPLFMLFSVLVFNSVQKRRFILAGIFTALAGFTRSLGVLLAVPVALTGLGLIVKLIKERKPFAGTLGRVLLGLAISTFGTLGYLYINYNINGDPFKFLEFQWSNWNQKASPFFDTPRYFLHYIKYSVINKPANLVSLWIPGLIAIFGSLLLILVKTKKLPAAYTVFFLCYYAVAVGCTWLLSSVRYLCAALPLTAAIAHSCDKRYKTVPVFILLFVLYLSYMLMYMKRMGIY